MSLTATYSELTLLASTRHHRLVECKQLHRFNRDSDEVEVWILAKEAVAQNEDVGKDLEHVEVRHVWNHNCISMSSLKACVFYEERGWS